MLPTGVANHIIEDVAGCGCFQAVVVLLVFILGRAQAVLNIIFMSFGIYNPGWKCLDKNSTTVGDLEVASNVTLQPIDGIGPSSTEYIKQDCPLFQSCSNIEFNPHVSTLVTEWGLLCDKAWIGKLIISLQMIGVLLGSLIVGQLADTFGRKPTLYGSGVVIGALTVVSIFSNSWQMYAVLRFFIGIACSGHLSLSYNFCAEFATVKWRASIAAVPAFSAVAVACGVLIMLLKDWRLLHIAIVVITVIGTVPAFWVPESLRWLEVKHKEAEFMDVASKITRMNGKIMPPIDSLPVLKSGQSCLKKDTKIYTMVDLFRPGYRIYTLVLGLLMLSNNVWYYVISFGVKTLSGDFYLNVIITFACGLPLQIVPFFTPHILDRKVSSFMFMGLASVCFLTAMAFALSPFTSLQTVGVRILILIAMASVTGNYCVTGAHISEIYPTVVRSLAQSWGSLLGRIGAIAAPFLIPSVPEKNHISYGIMGGLGIICCCALLQLRETRGKPLKQTFNDEEEYGYEDETMPVTI